MRRLPSVLIIPCSSAILIIRRCLPCRRYHLTIFFFCFCFFPSCNIIFASRVCPLSIRGRSFVHIFLYKCVTRYHHNEIRCVDNIIMTTRTWTRHIYFCHCVICKTVQQCRPCRIDRNNDTTTTTTMQSKKCLRYVCLAVVFAFVFLGLPKLCSSHGHHHHDDHGHDHDHGYSRADSKPPPAADVMLWVKALSSTVAISVLPFFVLFFIPIENKDEHQSFLKILLSFASGGLLGDAFLHLIPHSLSTHHHHDDHDHHHGEHCSASSENTHDHSNETRVGLWILAGILVFLFVEKVVRVIKGGHSHSHSAVRPKEKLSDDECDEKDQSVNHASELAYILRT